jgi:hypothetical protein
MSLGADVDGSCHDGGMRSVVFFRNVNQGQRGHPASAQLVECLTAAGLRDPRGFQSNGTYVVEGDAAAALPAAVDALCAATGRDEAAFALPLAVVAQAVAEFGAEFGHDGDRVEFSVFEGALAVDVPFRGVACTVEAAGEGWAFTRNDHDGAGQATAQLERLLGSRVSSRGMPTMLRLLARFDSPG